MNLGSGAVVVEEVPAEAVSVVSEEEEVPMAVVLVVEAVVSVAEAQAVNGKEGGD